MNLEKYNIKIEREALRINKKNSKSQKGFPKAFGKSETNRFIFCNEDDESILKIATPFENSIAIAYNKFEEITNVVIEELYKIEEYIWPETNYKADNTYAKITISLNEDFYEKLKQINSNLPENLEDAYLKIKENFEEKQTMFEKIYGIFLL